MFDLNRLTQLIDEHGLTEHRDTLLATVQPAMYMMLGSAGQGAVGQSRLGGTPDLPASLAWPREKRLPGYLPFLAQINLADLPRFAGSPLPEYGMFYLFIDDQGKLAWQHFYYGGDEPLVPTTLPPDAKIYVDWVTDVRVHQLHFVLGPDVPRWASDEYTALDDRFGASDTLDDLGRALSKDAVGRVLGHVAGIGHDPRYYAFLARETDAPSIYDKQYRDRVTSDDAARWAHLLTINTIDAADLVFGDAGYLQVLINREDLAKHEFARIYSTIESS